MTDSPTRSGHAARLFALIVIAYGLYAALFIIRSSFVLDGTRYFVLFDDGMVSMRYANNLAHGYGLVWNPGGERVEGFTNLLWVLYMAAIHLLPIGLAKTSLLVQITGAVCLIANLFIVRRIAESLASPSAAATMGAVALTAFYLPLNHYSLLGMEVSVLTLLVSGAVWTALKAVRDERFSAWPALLLGIGTLVRLDMVVPFLVVLAFLLVEQPARRRQHVAFGLTVLLMSVLSQTAFRVWYFGDVLPNTAYLKLTGYPWWLRISRGLYVTLGFVLGFNILLFAAPFVLMRRQGGRAARLALVLVLAELAYSVFVGGDITEAWGGSNRFVSVVMPLFFVLLSSSLWRLASILTAVPDATWARPLRLQGGWMVVLVAVAMLNVNAIHGVDALAEWSLISRPFQVLQQRSGVQMALALREITDPEASIAVTWAGALPYFAERTAVDILGKTDRYLAHLPMRVAGGRSRWVGFYPGHLKWDYSYSIGALKPDVVVQLWSAPEEARPYLKAYERVDGPSFPETRLATNRLWDVYIRTGSGHVRWDRVEPMLARTVSRVDPGRD